MAINCTAMPALVLRQLIIGSGLAIVEAPVAPAVALTAGGTLRLHMLIMGLASGF